MKFEELALSKPILDGIADLGFTDCTEVQSKVLPISLAGKDVMVQSKTGSGKAMPSPAHCSTSRIMRPTF